MKISQFLVLSLLALLLSSNTSLAAQSDSDQAETVTHQHGKLVWADLYTGDVEASLTFYTETFGWDVKSFTTNGPKYHILYDGEQPIAGVLERKSKRNQINDALWVGSIDTDDVSNRVDLAGKNGASIIMAPHDFKFYGKRAVLADAQGAVLALLELDLDNPAHKTISPKWDWAQLFSVDVEKAASFYEDTFAYSLESVEGQNNSVYLVQSEMLQAGIVTIPEAFEQRDRWVNFVEVDKLDDLVAKATANGASIVYQSDAEGVAIISDPNGALLGVIQPEAKQ